jgi:hypothetical protein
MRGVTDLCVVDYHTGIGPMGFGDLYYGGRTSDDAARRWFDHVSPTLEELAARARDPDAPTTGGQVPGMLCQQVADMLPGSRAIVGGIEYGTVPTPQVRHALREENWLYAHGDPASPRGHEIKARLRAAFYPSAVEWKIMVTSRSNDILRQALTGLARG